MYGFVEQGLGLPASFSENPNNFVSLSADDFISVARKHGSEASSDLKSRIEFLKSLGLCEDRPRIPMQQGRSLDAHILTIAQVDSLGELSHAASSNLTIHEPLSWCTFRFFFWTEMNMMNTLRRRHMGRPTFSKVCWMPRTVRLPSAELSWKWLISETRGTPREEKSPWLEV